MERQVNPLKRQAKKAEVYKEKKAELEKVEISVLVDEIEKLNKEIEALNKKHLIWKQRKLCVKRRLQ